MVDRNKMHKNPCDWDCGTGCAAEAIFLPQLRHAEAEALLHFNERKKSDARISALEKQLHELRGLADEAVAISQRLLDTRRGVLYRENKALRTQLSTARAALEQFDGKFWNMHPAAVKVAREALAAMGLE